MRSYFGRLASALAAVSSEALSEEGEMTEPFGGLECDQSQATHFALSAAHDL
jgi:hypothetical protein